MGGIEVPKPEREAQLDRSASAGAATIEVSPVPSGFEKTATPIARTGGPNRVRKIKRIIRRSSK